MSASSRVLAVSCLFVLVGCGAPERIERDLTTHLPKRIPAPSAPDSVHKGGLMREPSAREIARLQYSQCEPGQTRACFSDEGSPSPGFRLVMQCRDDGSGALVFDRSDCATPLVIALADEAIVFTRPAARAAFAVGPYAKTEWVSAATPWLALDRDGSGCVETQDELFGADDHAQDGFAKLARYDDDHDGTIDRADAVFTKLLVWRDTNQDARCTPDEVSPLAAGPVQALRLRATQLEPRLAGSHVGAEAALVWTDPSGHARAGRVVDVYLAPTDP